MLFSIDESIVEPLRSDCGAERERAGFKYLLQGVAEGSHRMAGKRSVLLQLCQLAWLSDRERAVLERALRRVAQEGSLSYRLATIGRVTASSSNAPVASSEGGQRVITFPLIWFDHSSRIQPVTLLGENLSDTKVLKIIAEVGMILGGHGYIPLNLSYAAGGGSTTEFMIEHYCKTEQICICIVDSDRVCPASRLGATANAAERHNDQVKAPLVGIMHTRGRDLENCLPDLFYSQVYGSPNLFGPVVDVLAKLTKATEFEVRAHIDIEKGFSLFDLFSYSIDSPEREFWNAKKEVIMFMQGIQISSFLCHNSQVCLKGKRYQCSCVAVSGITANVLEDFIKFCNEKDRFAVKNILDDSVRDEWTRLGSEIGSWCCGDSRLRI